MRRELAFTGVARHAERPIRSIACLVFVAILGVAYVYVWRKGALNWR